MDYKHVYYIPLWNISMCITHPHNKSLEPFWKSGATSVSLTIQPTYRPKTSGFSISRISAQLNINLSPTQCSFFCSLFVFFYSLLQLSNVNSRLLAQQDPTTVPAKRPPTWGPPVTWCDARISYPQPHAIHRQRKAARISDSPLSSHLVSCQDLEPYRPLAQAAGVGQELQPNAQVRSGARQGKKFQFFFFFLPGPAYDQV